MVKMEQFYMPNFASIIYYYLIPKYLEKKQFVQKLPLQFGLSKFKKAKCLYCQAQAKFQLQLA